MLKISIWLIISPKMEVLSSEFCISEKVFSNKKKIFEEIGIAPPASTPLINVIDQGRI